MPFSKLFCFRCDTPSESEIPARKMNETEGQRWSRSRYPLQPASEQAKLVSGTATESSGIHVSSSVRRSGLPHDVHTMNVEHRPVAESSVPASLANETRLPSPGSLPAPQNPIGSFGSVSPMLKSSPPTSSSQYFPSPSDGAQGTGISPPGTSYHNEPEAHSELSSQTQAECPFQATTRRVLNPDSTIISKEDGLDPGSSHLDGLSTDTSMKKTLRRTPRSWSLREIASQDFEPKSASQGSPTPSEQGVATLDAQKTAKEEYLDDLPQDQWRRQVYPVAPNTLSTPVPRSEEIPTTREELKQGREASLRGFLSDQRLGLTSSAMSDQFQSSPSPGEPGNETEDATQEFQGQLLGNVNASKEDKFLQRQNYPLQKAASNTEPLLESISPSSSKTEFENGSIVPATDFSENTLASQWTPSLKYGAYPLQAALKHPNFWSPQTNSPPWVEEPENHEKEAIDQALQKGQINSTTRSLRRGAYPLQSPASVLNLKASTTPPASSPAHGGISEDDRASEDLKPRSTLDKIQTFHRKAYPLQSPASALSLKEPTTLPSTFLEDDSVPANGSREEYMKPRPMVDKIQTLHRKGYPLQSPASVMDLKDRTGSQPPKAQISSVTIDRPPVDHMQENLHVLHDKNGFRRQVYPLQQPARSARLEHPPTPPSPVDVTSSARDFKAHWTNPGLDKQTPYGNNYTSKQSYPLQSSASIPALRLPPSPSPSPPPLIEADLQNGIKSSAHLSREQQLASKVITHWRRQIYPLQSPDSLSPFQRAPTPQPPGSETNQPQKTEPIHLPKNIRAVKEADTPGSGGRTIVVCLDGTGDKFDSDNSNIVHLISALKKDDPNQVSYYQAGIGTYTQGGLSSGLSAALDMAVGSELGLHVRDAYHFLMHSYKEGDKICIFGFSRGAYTARCLAGMIHKVGLLPPRNIQQIAFAYEFYTNDTAFGWEQSGMFKATFSIDISVHFLGCFDSVASVGFIPRQLPLSTTPGNKPRYFRHAMALDERRAKFKVCRHQTWDLRKEQQPERAFGISKDQNDTPPWTQDTRYGEHYHPNVTDEEYERLAEADDDFDTDVLEVWFAGAHADIGGGAVANEKRHKLAQIPLRWMIRQAFECDTGIIFKTKKLAEFGLDVHTLWPKYRRLDAPTHGPPPSVLEKYDKGLPPRSIRRSKLVPIDKVENGERFYHLKSHTDEDWTPELVEDFFDAMSPLNDQLVQAPRWWILEAWPVEYKVPVGLGQVETRVGMNLGRYRAIDDMHPKLHWTVRHREQHTNYQIRGRTAPHTQWSIVA